MPGWHRLIALVLLSAWSGGCERGGGGGGTELWGHERTDGLASVRVLALPEPLGAGATVYADGGGRVWLGRADGRFQVLDGATGALHFEVDLGTPGSGRVLGSGNERHYVLIDGELVTLDDAGVVRMRRAGLGEAVVALDPFARHVYTGTGTGAVIGLDPRLLRPRWAWARQGRAATALAVSPEGDLLYMALAGAAAGDAARLLVRDVQTGRILLELLLAGPAHDLQTAGGHDLAVLVDGEESAEVMLLRHGPDGLEPVWRKASRQWGLESGARLRVSPRGGRLAVFAPGAEGGLWVLDAASGEVLGEPTRGALDADFDAHGALFVLLPEEVRVLR